MSARPLAERRTGAASIVCLATCLAAYGKADDDLDPAQKSAAEVAFDATRVVSTILALPEAVGRLRSGPSASLSDCSSGIASIVVGYTSDSDCALHAGIYT